ncbi:MAG TPA: 3-oxoacyl-[acyl-carrier-protein] synthase III C-terminal domain-containing protein [Candidatus Angelobacter sp.]|nr:3-oxoacyl-[acyl-carrier-protein] synthase III C-terminal domain-containing protein [Candidatus Angelobacter sp.]
MSLQSIQSKGAGCSPALAFAGSVCLCEAYDLGISNPTMIVPENRISVEEYIAIHHGPCSFDDIEKYWRDYAIEPERLFGFLRSQSETFDLGPRAGNWANIHSVPVSNETSSELAVRAGKHLLNGFSGAASKIAAIIYYSATLSSRPAWSTSCRLHFELGLKCDTSFTVGQKGANASYAALRVAAEMLHVEQLEKVLLIGSEVFAPPHSRMFSGFSIQGDSASALLLGRGEYDFRLVCVGLFDFMEQPPIAADNAYGVLLDYWSEAAGAALTHLLEAAGMSTEKIAFVLPPGCNPELLCRIAERLRLPWGKFDCGALCEVGSLGSSDLVLNLNRISRSGVLLPGDEIMAFGFSSDGAVCGSILRYEPRRGAI